jgi:tryptophan halogenase
LFTVTSWVQVMLGQRLVPETHNRLAQMMPPGRLQQTLGQLAGQVAGAVRGLPAHQAYLDRM